jgi:hypothetical protein
MKSTTAYLLSFGVEIYCLEELMVKIAVVLYVLLA